MRETHCSPSAVCEKAPCDFHFSTRPGLHAPQDRSAVARVAQLLRVTWTSCRKRHALGTSSAFNVLSSRVRSAYAQTQTRVQAARIERQGSKQPSSEGTWTLETTCSCQTSPVLLGERLCKYLTAVLGWQVARCRLAEIGDFATCQVAI